MTTKRQLVREYNEMAEIARTLLDERDRTYDALDQAVQFIESYSPKWGLLK